MAGLAEMILTAVSCRSVREKRQVTFPAALLDALGVGLADWLELQEGPDGFRLQPQRIDFATLAPFAG